ncbi:uncharacterized protein LOC144635546 [Oculina patagonica]
MEEGGLEKSLCQGTAIPFLFMLLFITIPNGFILTALYKNPLRCFRKPFSGYLVFIAGVDFFVGSFVCSGEAVMRLLCAFGDGQLPQDGDIVRILGYIGVNSSILLVTAMSVDRFVAVVYPHFYLNKVTPRKVFICNSIIIVFSAIFASLQLAGISLDIYLLIDVHLHTTFPLTTTAFAYLGIFLSLKRRSRVHLQRQSFMPSNPTLDELRRVNTAEKERRFAKTSFLILTFLVVSLIPYFVAIVIDSNCKDCHSKNWFLVLRESSVAFLFVNSIGNPFLTTLRINELKQSIKIVVLRRKRHVEKGLVELRLRSSPG